MTKKHAHGSSESTVTAEPFSEPESVPFIRAALEGGPVAQGEPSSFPIVGVGASAGGLEAFTQLLEALPVDTGMAFVLVQHLAPLHASALAEILSRATRMPVLEVRDEPRVEPNFVYVIPPGREMVISQGRLQLLPREIGAHHRPIDRFFRSLAEEKRHEAIGVVLSGTASDGTLGLKAIKAEGGITFAQDATAQHDGMPHSAIASGCVDFVLPPREIADEITRIGRHPYTSSVSGSQEPGSEMDLTRVIQFLHHATGVDFRNYKLNTLYRRVRRRMVLQRSEGLRQYLRLLQKTPVEVEALFQDFLINVTSFFRNPATFEALKSEVFPELVRDRPVDEPLRVWTLGCSTGEETYSLAMAFTEFAEASSTHIPLQLFATDVNGRSIEKARAGVYSKDIAQDLSAERLARFFVEVDGHYRIAKSIRDVCVFSRHNALADPPFARIDLISCRNLLIYLEPVLQQRLLPLLHYALKPNGYLWLGASETIGSYRELFKVKSAHHKIYAKEPGPVPSLPLFPLQPVASGRTDFGRLPVRARDESERLEKEADRVLLTKFAPPGVLISAEFEILKYCGDTGPYLAPAPGKASLNLLKMLREGLHVGLNAAILRSAKEGAPVREEGLQVKSNGGYHEVAVEVIPIKGGWPSGGGFLVLFDEAAPSSPTPSGPEDRPQSGNSPSDTQAAERTTAQATDLTARLMQDLAATREHLQSVIEQQEAVNEELQSSNEEVQSTNEELQSINEELETSKEEIQSSNEELATVNDELNNRNRELDQLNNDLTNLFSSVQMAIVILGPDFCVRRFTPMAEQLLNLIPTDVGRPISSIKFPFNTPDLEPLLKEVLGTATTKQREVRDNEGRWYSLCVRPYKTLEDQIDGVVVMLIDVDMLKRAQEYTESIVSTVREPLLVLDSDLRVRTVSRSFYETFKVTPAATENHFFFDLFNGQWNKPELRRLLEEILPRDSFFTDFEMEHDSEPHGKKTFLLNARRLIQESDRRPSILLAIEDITERRRAEEAVRASEVTRSILESSGDCITVLDLDGRALYMNQPGMGLMEIDDFTPFVGQDWLAFWEGAEGKAALDSLAAAKAGSEARFQGYCPTAKGTPKWWDVFVTPIRDAKGGPQRLVAISRDMTELKRVEQALRDGDRRKNEFLAMLAHELRNPLAAVSYAGQILHEPGMEEMQEWSKEVIGRQVKHLSRLIDDLLDVSRITEGKIKLRMERVALSTIINRSVEATKPLIQDKKHQLTVSVEPDPITLDADATRLEQIFTNLISNAAKYTEQGGRILVASRLEGDECVVSVKDSGVGLSAEMLPLVFDLFTQVGATLHRSKGGLGIGLTLVKKLAELHGGGVQARSPGLGHGCEFTVRLPVSKSPVPEAPSPVAKRPDVPFQKSRILIVEDSVDTAHGLAKRLEMLGNEVGMAHDGSAALQVARAQRFDYILLDIGLPGLSGYEVASELRKEGCCKESVIIALTGYGQEEDRRRSLEAGINRHLVKPVEFNSLLTVLSQYQ